MMYVPIHSSGTVLGVLSIQSYAPRAYSQDDLTFLQALADHCGDALHRIKVTEALRETEAKYRNIFEHVTEGIFQSTPDGRYLNANPALARMFGYQSPAELITTVTNIERQTFVSAENAGELKRLLATQDYALGFEAERYRKDGGRFWTSINARTVRDAGGAVLYHEGTVRDITERKVVTSALRELAAIVENSSDGIISATLDQRIVSWNKSAERMIGYCAEEVMGQFISLLAPPEGAAELQQILSDLAAGKTVESFETVLRRKDGSRICVFLSVSPILDATGKVTGASAIARDITERKRLENEIAGISASERRRLSHELHDGLGQYLAGLAFRAKALEQTLAAAGLPYAQEAKDIVALISNAMAQTRSLARGLDPIGIETIGLVAALQILAAETEAIFNLTCRFQYTDTTLSLDAQKALALYRIVQEAIHNAITHGEARQITIELAMDTECLCLRVQDDGTGFAAGTGNLTGMGLRVMQYRARSIEARLEINSQINHGTEIRCLLPRAARFPAATGAGTSA